MLDEVTRLQPQVGLDSGRAADAMQAAALLLVTTVVAAGAGAVAVFALNIEHRPMPFLLTAGALVTGSFASSFIPERWIDRRHSRLTLTAASLAACACLYFIALTLGPWPDVLGEEVVKAGDLRFIWELLKGPFVFVAAAATAFGVLRYARHNRHQDGRAAWGRRTTR